MDWESVGAIGTVSATLVALGLGLRAEWRTKKDAQRSDEWMRFQVRTQERAREREFVLGQLVDLANAYVVFQGGGPGGQEAAQRIRLLLHALPPGLATLLRHEYQVNLEPKYGEIWKKYVPEDRALPPTPAAQWVYAELADNLNAVGRLPDSRSPQLDA